MSIYLRGEIWWYEFNFEGRRIRRSSKSKSELVAEKAERKYHRKLEMGTNDLHAKKQRLNFAAASRQWLEAMTAERWTPSTARIEGYNVRRLRPHFGTMLLRDITGDDITPYRIARKKAGASNRTINMEVGSLRAILRKHRLWANIDDVKMLEVRTDVGRALSEDEQHRLLLACKNSRSRSLYPAVVLSLHTGLRNGELRLLQWRQIDLLNRMLTVGKSKTEGGEGRIVPLSNVAMQTIQNWRSQFPEAKPSDYIFPSERYGTLPDRVTGRLSEKCVPYSVDPSTPIGSWKVSWTAARKEAGVNCRWHDWRHCFVSTLAESQASDATIMSLAGHLSRKMMERYSHTRMEAKRLAISTFDLAISEKVSPQFPPQSPGGEPHNVQ